MRADAADWPCRANLTAQRAVGGMATQITSGARLSPSPAIELSVVVPMHNESLNVDRFFERLIPVLNKFLLGVLARASDGELALDCRRYQSSSPTGPTHCWSSCRPTANL